MEEVHRARYAGTGTEFLKSSLGHVVLPKSPCVRQPRSRSETHPDTLSLLGFCGGFITQT